MDVRRVVTGHDANGDAVFVSDEQVAPVTLALLPGSEFHQIWGSDTTSSFPDDGTRPAAPRYFPAVGGFRFGFFTIPPDGGAGLPEGVDVGAALAEFAEKLPGLAEHLEPDDPGMHTTATIDYGVVLFGAGDARAGQRRQADAGRGRHLHPERHPAPVVQHRRRPRRARHRHRRRRAREGRLNSALETVSAPVIR